MKTKEERLIEKIKKAETRDSLLKHADFVEFVDFIESAEARLLSAMLGPEPITSDGLNILRGKLQMVKVVRDWLLRPDVELQTAKAIERRDGRN